LKNAKHNHAVYHLFIFKADGCCPPCHKVQAGAELDIQGWGTKLKKKKKNLGIKINFWVDRKKS
jgi:hypothetical protein